MKIDEAVRIEAKWAAEDHIRDIRRFVRAPIDDTEVPTLQCLLKGWVATADVISSQEVARTHRHLFLALDRAWLV